MSDNIGDPSASRKVGRGLARLLRGLLGRKNVAKAGESWRVLKEEFRAGREEAKEPEPKRIPHREVERDDPD